MSPAVPRRSIFFFCLLVLIALSSTGIGFASGSFTLIPPYNWSNTVIDFPPSLDDQPVTLSLGVSIASLVVSIAALLHAVLNWPNGLRKHYLSPRRCYTASFAAVSILNFASLIVRLVAHFKSAPIKYAPDLSQGWYGIDYGDGPYDLQTWVCGIPHVAFPTTMTWENRTVHLPRKDAMKSECATKCSLEKLGLGFAVVTLVWACLLTGVAWWSVPSKSEITRMQKADRKALKAWEEDGADFTALANLGPKRGGVIEGAGGRIQGGI